MISPDLLSSATRTCVSSQLEFATAMAESMIESMEKLMGLNLQAARASLDVSLSSAQQLMSIKDSQDLMNVSSSQIQPHADIVLTYVRHLTSISSGTHKQFARITQEQVSENSREIMSLLDELGSSTPEGSRGSISLLKSAIDNTVSGYDQIVQSTQTAIEQLQSTFSAASNQLTTLTTKPNGRSKK
jgi:phasin family protein